MVGRYTPTVYRDEHVRSAPKAMEIKLFCISSYDAKSPARLEADGCERKWNREGLSRYR